MSVSERFMRRAVCDWLVSQGLTPVFEVHLGTHLCDFVGFEFGERVGRKIPPLLRTLAVELKLDDIAGVLRQCKACRYRLHAAYAAMPAERCQRMKKKTLTKFTEVGVGLLAVSESVEMVLPAMHCDPQVGGWWKVAIPRRLWRRRDEWQPRLEEWEQLQKASFTP